MSPASFVLCRIIFLTHNLATGRIDYHDTIGSFHTPYWYVDYALERESDILFCWLELRLLGYDGVLLLDDDILQLRVLLDHQRYGRLPGLLLVYLGLDANVGNVDGVRQIWNSVDGAGYAGVGIDRTWNVGDN